jgi:hypothetical protein
LRTKGFTQPEGIFNHSLHKSVKKIIEAYAFLCPARISQEILLGSDGYNRFQMPLIPDSRKYVIGVAAREGRRPKPETAFILKSGIWNPAHAGVFGLETGYSFFYNDRCAGRSSNGKTGGSGPSDRGSNPCLPATTIKHLFAITYKLRFSLVSIIGLFGDGSYLSA